MSKDPKPPARKSASHPAGSAPGRTTTPASGGSPSQIVDGLFQGKLSLQQLKGITPRQMLAVAMIGYQLYEQGRYDKAQIVFQGLSVLDPSQSYYRTALGAVYLAAENLNMAQQVLTGALRINPNDLAAYVNRGEAYLRQGKVLEAAQDFKKAVELDPEKKDPISHRARLLATATLETIRAAQRQSGRGTKSAGPPSAPSAVKKK
jgi:tetratricopeptide (TPR) repeat protein